MSKVGEKIRVAREAKGFSQKKLATKVKLQSAQYISNIERGTSGASVNVLKRTCKVLGISLKPMVKLVVLDFESQLKKKIGLR